MKILFIILMIIIVSNRINTYDKFDRQIELFKINELSNDLLLKLKCKFDLNTLNNNESTVVVASSINNEEQEEVDYINLSSGGSFSTANDLINWFQYDSFSNTFNKLKRSDMMNQIDSFKYTSNLKFTDLKSISPGVYSCRLNSVKQTTSNLTRFKFNSHFLQKIEVNQQQVNLNSIELKYHIKQITHSRISIEINKLILLNNNSSSYKLIYSLKK
jgi:hypothetical protein